MANVITLEGGDIVVSAILDGGDIYPSGGGGGGLLQTKAVSYTPTESAQTDTVTADPGYDGLEEVDVTIGAISSTYVGSGVTRQAAQIIHPSTSDQSIPSGTYLTGSQGFKAVTTTNLSSGNIKNGVTVKVGDSSDDDRIISVTGTYSGGGANLESKSVSYTPTETAITALVTPSTGYDGLSQVDVTVGAISSSYVGSAVTRRDSSDLSASGATVTAPSGYYASSATKTITNASQSLTDAYMQLNGDLEVELNTGTAGYVSSGNQYLQFASFATPQSAQTIYPSTSDQTIPADTYTLGAQTIKGVTYSGLDAGNIKKDVVVKIGDSSDDDRILSVTGTYEGGGGGTDYFAEMQNKTLTSYSSTAITSLLSYAFRGATSLEDVSLPNLTSVNDYAFNACTGLETVSLPVCTLVRSHAFEGCNNSGFTTVVLPLCTAIYSQSFQSCSNLEAVDILGGGNQIGQQSFRNDTPFNVLVIRASSVTPLQNVNVFESTKFASNGTGGTLYVPNDVISSYQSASNWSTILGYANNQIKKIEGSYYETHYVDGTAI